MRSVLLPLLLFVTAANAQISEVATLDGRVLLLRSLAIAGPKYIEVTSTGFTLFNTDLTEYQSTTFPPLPPNYQYEVLPNPRYVTEDLFDQDPSTIEYLMTIQEENFEYTGVMVARMDGTILLMEPEYGLAGAIGSDPFTSMPFVFQTDEGAFLMLGQGVFGDPSSRIYSLPGQLPCIACDPNGTTVGMDGLETSGNLFVFPNPTADLIRVVYQGGMPALIHVFDAAGRSVLREGPISSTPYDLSVQGLSQGVYDLVVTDRNGGRIATRKFVVER